MCTLGAAGLALGALSSGASAIGAQQQRQMQFQAAKQQAEMQRRLNRQAIEAAKVRAGRQVTGKQLQYQQELEGLARQEREEVDLAAQADLGRQQALLAERGISGQTVEALFAERRALQGAQREALSRQRQFMETGRVLAVEDIYTGLGQQIRAKSMPIPDPIYERPSLFGDVLSVASGGLQGARTGLQIKGMMEG